MIYWIVFLWWLTGAALAWRGMLIVSPTITRGDAVVCAISGFLGLINVLWILLAVANTPEWPSKQIKWLSRKR